MQRELKHITPYLQHGLTCNLMGRVENKYAPLVFKVTGVDQRFIEIDNGVDYYEIESEDFFPLLRPMSDLFEKIVHNGEIVCVAELIRNLAPDEKQLWGINKKHQTLTNISRERFWYPVKNPLGLPYWAIEMLFKYHFDVFGLIEKGLAEPIKQQQWKG